MARTPRDTARVPEPPGEPSGSEDALWDAPGRDVLPARDPEGSFRGDAVAVPDADGRLERGGSRGTVPALGKDARARRGGLRTVRLYARPGWHMGRQLAGDALFVLWCVIWFVVARVVKHLVDALAAPTQKLVDAAQQVSSSAGSAGSKVQGVPGVGGTIAEPFQVLHDQVSQLASAATHQITTIHHVAWAIALVVFFIPVLVACWRWLPGRIRFVRQATATRRLIDSSADLDLFALRAMANLPMATLARVSDDPVGDWRNGDRDVIEKLASLELERNGLSLPRPKRNR